jgi:putative hydrolase of the HAD superfamily
MLRIDKIKHIFFDLDHTLWDFEKNSALTFEVLLSEQKIDVPLDRFLEVYVPLNREYWKRYRLGEFTAEELRFVRLEDVFNRLGRPLSREQIGVLAEAYIDKLSTYPHLIAGALEVLRYLKPRYPLHILTNGFTRIQQRKLESSGIQGFFTQVIDAERVGVKKPDPIIFERAEELVSARQEELLMIGDDLEADIMGARNRGWQTIYLNDSGVSDPQGGLQINELHEIKQLLSSY